MASKIWGISSVELQLRIAKKCGQLTTTQQIYVYLQDLLILIQNRKFTDERDPVFAALGLAKTIAQHYQKYLGDWIVLNYQDTAAKVYEKLYRLIAQNTASLSFPSQASRESKTVAPLLGSRF